MWVSERQEPRGEIVDHELLLETELCVQLHFLVYFERGIIVSLYKGKN